MESLSPFIGPEYVKLRKFFLEPSDPGLPCGVRWREQRAGRASCPVLGDLDPITCSIGREEIGNFIAMEGNGLEGEVGDDGVRIDDHQDRSGEDHRDDLESGLPDQPPEGSLPGSFHHIMRSSLHSSIEEKIASL